MNTSHYLFLQGQIGRFFGSLGQALQARGHGVHHLHFNAGDALFWPLPGSVGFRGRAEDWPAFLAAHLDRWQITDLVLFGDCRPLHRAAIALAARRGITVQVFEEGYLRPEFITLEQGGVNGHSRLPRCIEPYLADSALLPPWQPGASIPASFARRSAEDVLYHLATAAGRWRFPHYRHHRPWSAFTEYAVGARRLPLKALTRQRTTRQVDALLRGATPYFLFPLQLEADAQIRFHAPAGGMRAAIARVIASFAAQAPAEARLVLTEHPLDYGPQALGDAVRQAAAGAGIAARVDYLRGGSPPALIAAARGMVTVNSTIGITALATGVPVVTLGQAIYDMAGLTHQGGLDAFWQQPEAPVPRLFEAFRQVLAARTQINGGFYSAEGIARATAGAVQRLEQMAAERRRPAAAVDDPIDTLPAWPPALAPAAALPLQA